MIIMGFVPQWAPNIHPMLVHFPIAIFFFAVLMDFLSFFLPNRWWGERKTIITYVIGAISVIAVYFTGKMASSALPVISDAAQHAVDQHLLWALRTLWFFIIYTLIRLYLFFTGKIRRMRLHIIMLLISLIGLFFLFEAGEHGAKLVFKYRVNKGKEEQSAALGTKKRSAVYKPDTSTTQQSP